MSKFCPNCGSKINDDDEICTNCGNEIKVNTEKNFVVSKKLVLTIVAIIIIVSTCIFIYSTVTHNNVFSEIQDSAKVESVIVTDWNNNNWEEDKILYVTVVPTKNINNSGQGELTFDETVITYSDGSSETLNFIVGEWSRDKVFYKGESYIAGGGFLSNGKTPVHVKGKIILHHFNEDKTNYEKEIIAHFDSDV